VDACVAPIKFRHFRAGPPIGNRKMIRMSE
jgi:hypothetical protein